MPKYQYELKGPSARDVYAWVFSTALCQHLFEFDQVLSGKADNASFRLIPERYEEAQSAIATLYRIVKHPDLEPTPLAEAMQCAQRDVGFQTFMRDTLHKPRRRLGKQS